MKIYTSYFGNYQNFGDKKPVSIALYSPTNFKGIRYIALAPTKEILEFKNNEDGYTKLFKKKLYKMTASSVYAQLKLFSENKDVVLLCYEKPPQFCHRHLVAEWLEKELNIEVKELTYKK